MTDLITREDVIRMAKESGFKACVGTTDKEGNYHPFVNALGKDIPIEWLERFAALAALRAQPAGWIAVSERLPKPWDAVMVHPRPNDYVNEAYLNHKGVWMYSEYVTDFGDQAYPCVVTHWMPLPPPPGQERAQPADPFKKLSDAQVLWLAESHGIDVYASNPLAFYADLISTTPAQPDHSEQHLELVSAARAVVERWDTPWWKDVPATAVYINRLRDALQHLQAIGEAKE